LFLQILLEVRIGLLLPEGLLQRGTEFAVLLHQGNDTSSLSGALRAARRGRLCLIVGYAEKAVMLPSAYALATCAPFMSVSPLLATTGA